MCALALARPDGTLALEVEGVARGRILHAPRGTYDFGYDPLFLFDEPGFPESGHAFAELGLVEKSRVSHRGRALKALVARLPAVRTPEPGLRGPYQAGFSGFRRHATGTAALNPRGGRFRPPWARGIPMQLTTLLGRTSSSLFLLAVLAAPSPADDLFVASTNTLIGRGNAMSGGFQVVGGCFGQPQSIAVDGQNAFFGDPIGRIYFFDGSIGSTSLLTDTTSDARALAVRGQELLVGGSDGTIQRIHKVTAVPLGTWTVSGDVSSLAVLGNRLFAGSSTGLITELDINGGTAGFFGVCGGTATSMALDSTHLIVGTSSGFIFRMNLTTGFTDAFFDTGHDITSIVVQGGSLLTAGSEGVIRRIHRISGAPQGTMSWPFDISTMGVATSPVGLGELLRLRLPVQQPRPDLRLQEQHGCRLHVERLRQPQRHGRRPLAHGDEHAVGLDGPDVHGCFHHQRSVRGRPLVRGERWIRAVPLPGAGGRPERHVHARPGHRRSQPEPLRRERRDRPGLHVALPVVVPQHGRPVRHRLQHVERVQRDVRALRGARLFLC